MALVKQIYLVLKSPMLSDNILIWEINYINMVLLIFTLKNVSVIPFHGPYTYRFIYIFRSLF